MSVISVASNLYAQDDFQISSNIESTNSVDYYNPDAGDIVYNFNELPTGSLWDNIQYPYANFYSYDGRIRITNVVFAPSIFYPNFMVNDLPYAQGRPGVYFEQPVHNVSFSVIGGDGGFFRADIYRNRQFFQTLTFPTSCGGYTGCFIDLRPFTNVTGIDFHSINDLSGVGFDDFRFALGAGPTPTPNPTPTPAPNQLPNGYLDGVTQNEGIAFGWSSDPDNLNVPNVVHFYIDGTASTNFAGAMVANKYRSDVGNHSFEFDIPDRFRDNQPHLIRAYGLDLTNCPATLLISPKTFTLPPRVGTVVFESINNETINNELTDSEVETIPGINGRPSQRIFPDKKQPGEENINRKRVRVKASLTLPVQGIQVYFRNFDVDDPSTDILIDENGNVGNDN